MKEFVELEGSFVVDVNDDEDYMAAVRKRLSKNNETAENRFYENLKVRKVDTIILKAEISKKQFEGLSHEEIRDAIFQDIEGKSDSICVSFLERKHDDINEIKLGQ